MGGIEVLSPSDETVIVCADDQLQSSGKELEKFSNSHKSNTYVKIFH